MLSKSIELKIFMMINKVFHMWHCTLAIIDTLPFFSRKKNKFFLAIPYQSDTKTVAKKLLKVLKIVCTFKES